MRILRVTVTWLVVIGVSTSAFAGDLQASVARAIAQQQAQPASGPISKGYLWLGTGLFVGGMTVGLYGFLNNRNGDFPEFGEATATNKYVGAAGLAAAFVGGTVLFLGTRQSRRSPAVTFGPGRVTVSKRLSW